MFEYVSNSERAKESIDSKPWRALKSPEFVIHGTTLHCYLRLLANFLTYSFITITDSRDFLIEVMKGL